MRGGAGFVIGAIVLTIGLAGLGFALHLLMTHADPDTNAKAAAGLATFVVASLVSLGLVR